MTAAKSTTRRSAHLFLRDSDEKGQAELHCTRCGRSYRPRWPLSVDMLLAILDVFKKEHATCGPEAKART